MREQQIAGVRPLHFANNLVSVYSHKIKDALLLELLERYTAFAEDIFDQLVVSIITAVFNAFDACGDQNFGTVDAREMGNIYGRTF